MSQEDLEIVRTTMEAFMRRDFDEVIARWHEDGEWQPGRSPGGLEGATYVGHDGVRRWAAELEESWGTFEVVNPTYEAVGERVLVLAQVHARGRSSGVETNAPLAQIWELEKGKVRRVRGFFGNADALKAAGLAE